MTTAAAIAFPQPQIEAANFLNLMIVDDERAIREVCSEVAHRWASILMSPIPPNMPTVNWTRRASM